MAKKKPLASALVVETIADSLPDDGVLDVVATANAGDIVLTDRGTRESCLGTVTQLKIFRPGHKPLTWGEVWRAFSGAYPGRWAVQVFPPADRLLDSKDVYHLFLLDGKPEGLDLR